MSSSALHSAAPGSGPTRDDALRSAVASLVGGVQAQLLAGVPAGAARLARLRRALTSEPGSDPTVWVDTVGALPHSLLGSGDAPSAAEQAAHTAVCLYALHQQSQGAAMHRTGDGLGRAVQVLQRARQDDDDSSPVLRRFHALATATIHAETLHHLRGLVTLLRGSGVPLDYGRLAVDLRRLQDPRSAPAVRLAWGRDLYRRPTHTTRLQDPDLSATTTPGAPA